MDTLLILQLGQWSKDNKDEVSIWLIKRVVGLLAASIWRPKLLGTRHTPNLDQGTCNTANSSFLPHRYTQDFQRWSNNNNFPSIQFRAGTNRLDLIDNVVFPRV